MKTKIPELKTHMGKNYFVRDSRGQWYYLNHANTWQTCPPPFPKEWMPRLDRDTELLEANRLLLERARNAEKERDNLQRQLIYGFYEEEYPIYSNYPDISELHEIVTPDEINNLINIMKTYKELLKEVRDLAFDDEPIMVELQSRIHDELQK